MAKITAIEWDDHQLRGIVASVSGSSISVSKAFAVALDAGGDDSDKGSHIERISKILHDQKVGRGDAVISVGRSGTELRVMEVPAAPEAEFAPLVRFQALRQFAAMTEDWTLDYVPLQGSSGYEQVKVIAAAISPQLLDQIRGVCDKSHLSIKRIPLRPFSMASVISRLLPSDKARLCLDVAGEEADLLVLNGINMEMVRTVRLLRDSEGKINLKQTVGELRRTIVAYGNQVDSAEIEQVVVCGSEDDLPLAEEIHQQLSIDATVFDATKLVDSKGGTFEKLGADRSRFVGLIGAVMSPETVDQPGVDFQNPRKPPAPIAERRRNALVGAVVATLVLAVVGYFGLQVYMEGAKVERLREQAGGMRSGHDKVVERVMDFEMINDFSKGAEYNWLDEITNFSEKLPDEGVIVDSLSFNLNSENRATMTVTGRATDSNHIEDLESDMRDERHEVTPRNSESITGERDFPWKFGGLVLIKSPKVESKPTSNE